MVLLNRLALKILSRAMNKDPDYAWTYQCNLAVMSQDAGAPHKESNERAADFMGRLFDVDIRAMFPDRFSEGSSMLNVTKELTEEVPINIPATQELGTLVSEENSRKKLRTAIKGLYNLLDDIDTVSDIAKENNIAYRNMVLSLQAKKNRFVVSDGYELYMVK